MRILVTHDGSSQSMVAVEPAANLARAASGEIVLLRVLRVPLDVVAHPDEQHRQSRLDALEAEAKQELREIAEGLDVPARADVRRLGRRWNVVDEILAVAAEYDADLICMATHGEGALRHFVLGSTALDVLSKSERPVLLVRSP
jgi:nucleotide-binding universal stress UspA family protein